MIAASNNAMNAFPDKSTLLNQTATETGLSQCRPQNNPHAD
jgi:hypothetical protein